MREIYGEQKILWYILRGYTLYLFVWAFSPKTPVLADGCFAALAISADDGGDMNAQRRLRFS